MHLSFDIQVFFRIHLFFLSDPQNVHIDLNIPVLLLRCGNIQDKHALEQHFQKL